MLNIMLNILCDVIHDNINMFRPTSESDGFDWSSYRTVSDLLHGWT